MTHLSPDPTGSNLDHALLYHALGWWVFPGRDPLDLQEFRNSLIRQGKSHDAAYEEAERARKHTFVAWKKCPKSCKYERTPEAPHCPKHERRARGEAGRPTEAEIRDWFDESRPLRSVIILTGPGATAGGQLVGVDVDVLKGGDEGPWTGPAVTMLARSPSGGCHAYHFATNEEEVKSSAGKVAEGIDIRGADGLLVAPSGIVATPGRTWERWGPLSPAPLAEIRRRLAERRPAAAALRPRAPVAEGDEDIIPDAPPMGAFVLACTTIAPPGKRQPVVSSLVGMLAKQRPLPPDAVQAAINLLRENRTDLADETLDELAEGWRAQLESSERSLNFALTVLRAWNAVRVSPSWSDDELVGHTCGIWNNATQKEAAAREKPPAVEEPHESNSDGLPDGVVLHDEDDPPAPSRGVLDPPTVPEMTPEEKEKAQDAATEKDIDTFMPCLCDDFNLDAFGALLEREMIPCGVLPPWRKVLPDGSVVPVTNTPEGHGFGEALDDIIGGGLKPGYMAVVGAEAAKDGKTALMDQWMDGIVLRSAEVLDMLKRGEQTDEPIIIRYDLSEMNAEDLTTRQLGRWLGIDSTVFRRGRNGYKAPGIRALANLTGEDPRVLAKRYADAARAEMTSGRLAEIRGLRRIVNPRTLCGRSDPKNQPKTGKAQDNRRGVPLLQSLAAYIAADVALKAKRWGVECKQIVPLIFIDPIQRFQAANDNAVGALDELVEELRAVADELGAIVFCTSDTNKESAKAANEWKAKGVAPTPAQIAAGVFRGSYKLLHLPDVAFVLRPVPGFPNQKDLLVGINRWNGQADPIRLDFDRQTGRYTPTAPVTVSTPICTDDDDLIVPPEPLPPIDIAGLLTPTQAKVLQLYQAGKTEDEIATIQGSTKDAVQKHLYRARHACDKAQGLPASKVPHTTNADLKRATL